MDLEFGRLLTDVKSVSKYAYVSRASRVSCPQVKYVADVPKAAEADALNQIKNTASFNSKLEAASAQFGVALGDGSVASSTTKVTQAAATQAPTGACGAGYISLDGRLCGRCVMHIMRHDSAPCPCKLCVCVYLCVCVCICVCV